MDIRAAALLFSACAVLAHWLPWAQPFAAYWLLAGGLLLAARRLRAVAVALLGVAWTTWHVAAALDGSLEAACPETQVQGRVADLPTRTVAGAGADDVLRFEFETAGSAPTCAIAGRLRLVWVGGPELRGGEGWSLSVRLRPPVAGANRGGFDGGRWYARHGIVATGYVTAGRRLDPPTGPAAKLDRVRERVRGRLEELPLVHAGVLSALTLGDAAAIAREEMELYRRTTTMHLLVISGLHVGVVTAFGFFIGRGLAYLLAIRQKPLATVGGLVCSAAYVLLAGAGLSLIRAFAMSAIAMLALVSGRSTSALGVFALAAAAVLLVDPFAPLAAGFWLSFGAVAVLLGFFAPRIDAVARAGRPSWVGSALQAQVAMALVFAPATVAITGLIHPLGIGINLVAVPLVTLLTVPLALAGAALAAIPPGEWLLTAADFCVAWCATLLRFADRVEPFHVAGGAAWLPAAGIAAAACLLPLSRLAKAGLASVVALVLAWPVLGPAEIPRGHMEVETLDVGQGTSVLVRTRGHVLLYDAGPRFYTGGDAGSGVVVPALRERGVDRLDTLVLSHSDVDHIGGAQAVLGSVRADAILAGEPVPGIAAERCARGGAWTWDDVRFSVVWPPEPGARQGNSASCVLLIEAADRRVLLAGDIDAAAEHALALPPVDVLLVPHHGSATSSSASFVAMTRPRFAIVGSGWDNHFGHPHPDVVARYRDVGSHVLSTAISGALLWRSVRPDAVEATRCRQSPYWQQLPGGAWRRPSALSLALADCSPSSGPTH